MNNKEYKTVKKEVAELLTDFGFVDPDNVISQLKNIFEVEDEDVNEMGRLRGQMRYDVHYGDYVITLIVDNYEFKIIDIYEYNDKI